MIKRLIDIVAASLGLLLLSPLMLVIALAVKLDSPGPVFFRQVRVGRHGRLFRIFKFRTMTQGAAGSQITIGADARVTRIGALLRRWKLDELAQLIDVLRGTMSLVGPRPEVPHYVDLYPPERRAQVLSVRPGITDFASLKFRNESELLARADDPEREYLEVILPEKLRLAANQVTHAHWRSDLKLLGLTLKAVLGPALPDRKVARVMKHRPLWQTVDRLMSEPSRHRVLWEATFDGLVVLGCWHLTYLFRLGFERWQPGRAWYDDAVSLAVALTYLVCLSAWGARAALWRFFSFDDFRRVALACISAGLVCAVAIQLAQLTKVSRAVLVLHPLFSMVGLLLVRMAWRGIWEHAHALATGEAEDRHLVIVVGANVVARRLISGLHLRHGWQVLMLLDDDRRLHGLRIAGVPVAGSVDRLLDPALTMGATDVVMALDRRTQGALCERVLVLAAEAGLPVLEVPDPDGLREAAPGAGAAGAPG